MPNSKIAAEIARKRTVDHRDALPPDVSPTRPLHGPGGRAEMALFDRLHHDWLVARASLFDPDGPTDEEDGASRFDRYERAERALIAARAPRASDVWTKWEILDRLVIAEATEGEATDHRVIFALASIKADVMSFGLED